LRQAACGDETHRSCSNDQNTIFFRIHCQFFSVNVPLDKAQVLNHCVQHVTTFNAEKSKCRDYLKRDAESRQVPLWRVAAGKRERANCANVIKIKRQRRKYEGTCVLKSFELGCDPAFLGT
jgi:hypothetical protein